jgi:hypothetical protein
MCVFGLVPEHPSPGTYCSDINSQNGFGSRLSLQTRTHMREKKSVFITVSEKKERRYFEMNSCRKKVNKKIERDML